MIYRKVVYLHIYCGIRYGKVLPVATIKPIGTDAAFPLSFNTVVRSNGKGIVAGEIYLVILLADSAATLNIPVCTYIRNCRQYFILRSCFIAVIESKKLTFRSWTGFQIQTFYIRMNSGYPLSACISVICQ